MLKSCGRSVHTCVLRKLPWDSRSRNHAVASSVDFRLVNESQLPASHCRLNDRKRVAEDCCFLPMPTSSLLAPYQPTNSSLLALMHCRRTQAAALTISWPQRLGPPQRSYSPPPSPLPPTWEWPPNITFPLVSSATIWPITIAGDNRRRWRTELDSFSHQ